MKIGVILPEWKALDGDFDTPIVQTGLAADCKPKRRAPRRRAARFACVPFAIAARRSGIRDAVSAVCDLLSDEARYVTGTNIYLTAQGRLAARLIENSSPTPDGAGAMGGAREGSPRHSRIFCIASGVLTAHKTLILAPRRGVHTLEFPSRYRPAWS
jgi:hypothetical protein